MKLRLLSSLIFLSVFVFFAKESISRDDSAPVGRTGAPMENSCGVGTTGCHNSLSAQSQFAPDLVLMADNNVVDDNFEYEAGTTYNMNFTINNATFRNGFSLTTLNANNEYVGNFSIPGGSDAEVKTSAPLSRDYVGHTNTLGVNDWDFKWTAPATGSGTISIYASANKSNNNGTRSNDSIIPFVRTIIEFVDTSTTIRNLASLDGSVRILNNPIINNEIVLELNAHSPDRFVFQVFNINGKLVQMPTQEVAHTGSKIVRIPLLDTEKGMYLLKVSTDANKFSTFKILK